MQPLSNTQYTMLPVLLWWMVLAYPLERFCSNFSRKFGDPSVFFSRKLSPPESKYSTFGRELMAAYLATKHFQHFLERHPFTVFMDLKTLMSAYASSKTNYTPPEVHVLPLWPNFELSSSTSVGSANIPAVALSQLGKVSSSNVSLEKLDERQKGDQELQTIWSSSTALNLQEVCFPNHNVEVTCSISIGRQGPLVPYAAKFLSHSIHSLIPG